jgi:hypothetical protein
VLTNILPATDNTDLLFRTSTNNGSSYDAGASDYKYNVLGGSIATATSIVIANNLYNAQPSSGYMFLFSPSTATRCNIFSNFITHQTAVGAPETEVISGYRDSAADVDAVRFLMSSGNITSGTIRMYGIVNS